MDSRVSRLSSWSRIPWGIVLGLAICIPLALVACGDDEPTDPGVIVAVSPATANVNVGGSAQFDATVTGTSETGVTWSVVGGVLNGTISVNGFYSAPAGLPANPEVKVRATSTADATRFGEATVTLTDNFIFASDPAGNYTRVDRMGSPAVATAVISTDNKNEYNADNPVVDLTGKWAADITTRVTALHTALDDDLAAIPLTPCVAGNCVTTAGGYVIPDDLSIDVAAAPGFPNGRRLTDQVIDITLALLLLDLNVHSVTTLAALPVNPPANNVAFKTTFPYLADPN